jgi:hypothetical protein
MWRANNHCLSEGKAREACTCKRNIEANLRHNRCCGKATSIPYSERVYSLWYTAFKAHAPYYIVICGLSVSTSFYHIISNGTVFGITFRVSLQLGPVTFFIIRRIKRDTIIDVGLHVRYPLFMSGFTETWDFSKDFLKIHENQIQWQSVQWELSCSMRTDRREDRHN